VLPEDMSEFCKQFGFDQKSIQRRITLLRLNKHDHDLADSLNNDVIRPNIQAIINRFYEILLFNPETRIWLTSGEVIEQLKRTQGDYLLDLGIQFDSEDYFEKRLHIGVIHAAIGLPLNTYLCAYSIMTQIIIDFIPEKLSQETDVFLRLVKFLNKITSLDMSLAVEAYHNSQITNMEVEVEELHSRETRLMKIAETDSLTGLYNRGAVFIHLTKSVSNCTQNNTTMSLLMIDIDLFKKINDTLGHQVGDIVIHSSAKRIAHCLRPGDIIGRYGGEEFIVGLNNLDSTNALSVAERIRSSIAEKPIEGAGDPINVTISIGMATLKTGDTLDSLINRADYELYQAKNSGRNCVVANTTNNN